MKKQSTIKPVLTLGLLIFFALYITFLATSLFIKSNLDKLHREEIIKSEENLIQAEKVIVSNKVSRLLGDVQYIADSVTINGGPGGDQTELKTQWMAFSNRKRVYDQIRFLDLSGREQIRINYADTGAYVTKQQNLQDKKDRTYFKRTIELEESQIFISVLDLNLEYGRIEQPQKPMIRLCTPIFGTEGQLEGIVVLNYSAEDMLQQIREIASVGNGAVFLLNSDGYWLYNGQDPNKEWAFMYPDREEERFQNLFPEEWDTLRSKQTGSLATEDGLFTHAVILTDDEFTSGSRDIETVMEEGPWYLVSCITADSVNGAYFHSDLLKNSVYIMKNGLSFTPFLLGISFLIALLITMNQHQKDRIRYFSEYDTMTGIYNRRAGFEKLNKLYKEAVKENGKICICFIDINGLKQVNDVLGHAAGDELIKSVVQGIQASIRSTDIAVRLGGDEFLIILPDLGVDLAEQIWTRISAEYQRMNDTEGRDYLISVSHGIDEFKFDSDEYIDTIINSADEKMYQEKRIMKQGLNVVRTTMSDVV